MKITIYELLGLIKDGKAPKKIIYDGHTYEYSRNGCVLDDFNYFSITNGLLYNTIDFENHLNDEIEILEEVEDKEYEDIEETDVALLGQCDNWLRCPTNEVTKQDIELNPYIINNIRENTLEFQHKINALIRNQKYILERLEKGE